MNIILIVSAFSHNMPTIGYLAMPVGHAAYTNVCETSMCPVCYIQQAWWFLQFQPDFGEIVSNLLQFHVSKTITLRDFLAENSCLEDFSSSRFRGPNIDGTIVIDALERGDSQPGRQEEIATFLCGEKSQWMGCKVVAIVELLKDISFM